jgi:peptidyl-dipeptidase A
VRLVALGLSRPWPEAIRTFTGTSEISAEPMIEYFRPLLGWLREQNRGRRCGW